MTKWDQNTRPQGYDHDNLLNALISSATWYGLIWLDSSKNMVPKELQIRSYLVSQPSMSGFNTFWSRRFYKCSEVNTGKHIMEISIRKEIRTWIMCSTTGNSMSSMVILNGLLLIFAPYQHLLAKEIPKLKTTIDQTNSRIWSKNITKNQNSVQSELVEIVVPQSHYASEMPLKNWLNQTYHLNPCHGASQGPEDRYHEQWSKVLKAKRSKFRCFFFASKKWSLWRMLF